MSFEKMKVIEFLAIFAFLAGNVLSAGQRDATLPYTAAFVEFNLPPIMNGNEKINKNVDQVASLIKADQYKTADILVFPEYILNDETKPIPLPDSIGNGSLCDSQDIDYLLRNISCAVRDSSKYVVIELIIKDDAGDLYNSALAFDRTGALIAKYRKFHTFNEPKIKRPSKPDVVTFDTDFGVTFGLFICFDLLFEEPAMTLVEKGIKNFIFPTMWYSELPFLTALQIQHGWAYANNVNLIAANVNCPKFGLSGSGIMAGTQGPIVTFFSDKPETAGRLAAITGQMQTDPGNKPKILARSGEGDGGQTQLNDINIWQEDLTKYDIEFLNIANIGENDNLNGKICKNGTCCSYAANVFAYPEIPNKSSYHYAFAFFNGNRSFVAEKGVEASQRVCSIIACTKLKDKKSCGKRLPTSPKIYKRFKIDALTILTEYQIEKVLTMPSVVKMDLNIFKGFTFNKTDDGGQYRIEMKLTETTTDLLTFGTYSRDFKQDTVKSGFGRMNDNTCLITIGLVVALFMVQFIFKRT